MISGHCSVREVLPSTSSGEKGVTSIFRLAETCHQWSDVRIRSRKSGWAQRMPPWRRYSVWSRTSQGTSNASSSTAHRVGPSIYSGVVRRGKSARPRGISSESRTTHSAKFADTPGTPATYSRLWVGRCSNGIDGPGDPRPAQHAWFPQYAASRPPPTPSAGQAVSSQNLNRTTCSTPSEPRRIPSAECSPTQPGCASTTSRGHCTLRIRLPFASQTSATRGDPSGWLSSTQSRPPTSKNSDCRGGLDSGTP